MQVIEFLKAAPSITDGLAQLKNELGIRVKIYEEEGLILLDYNQIESPKTHPIVMECRGLIIDNDCNIVCRPFDRFFNYGEALNVMPEIDWKRASIFEKVDGSLIKIYFDGRRWQAATRGTAFAESDCMGHGITFRELVFKAMSEAVYDQPDLVDECKFQELCEWNLSKSVTYLCELTSVENRVVKHYHGYKLHFLGARNTATGEYLSYDEGIWHTFDIGAEEIKKYSLGSADEALEAARQLKDLDEGFIVYQDGVPVAKIKSPAYVAVHHIRGEGLNPKRISELVLSGEVEEYLTYFPEDRPVIQPYIDGFERLELKMEQVYRNTWHIEDQKEFAQSIAGLPFKGVLFAARKSGGDVMASFNQQRMSFRIDLLKEYVR